jgi:hypothetical protein
MSSGAWLMNNCLMPPGLLYRGPHWSTWPLRTPLPAKPWDTWHAGTSDPLAANQGRKRSIAVGNQDLRVAAGAMRGGLAGKVSGIDASGCRHVRETASDGVSME